MGRPSGVDRAAGLDDPPAARLDDQASGGRPSGQVVELGSYILKELAFVTDAIAGEFGATNSTTVTLSLLATPPKTTPPPPPPPKTASSSFYGEWGVHGGSAEFRADGTGRARNHNGFTDDGDWIDVVVELKTTLSADGKTLNITITKVGFELDGKPVSKNPTKYPPGYSVGDTFTAVIVRPGLMEVTPVKTATPTNLGNPYLCGDGISTADQQYCGA